MKLDDVIFFFVRHGETAGNKDNVYRGWSNAPEAQLNSSGKKASEEAGQYLKSIGADIQLMVYDSLDRVQETMELIANSFPGARMESVRALHPLNMGDYTLKSKDRYPVEPFLKDTGKRIPGGDTVAEFDKRQFAVFGDIFPLALNDYPGGKVLVGGHGSNVAFLFNRVFSSGKVGYEGLVDPGGVIAVTARGLIPLTRTRGEKKDQVKEQIKQPSSLVQLSKWSVGFVGGKETDDQPKSCFNCHLMYRNQKTCSILGPDIIIKTLNKDGKLYTPVCGEQDAGTPMDVPDDEAKYNLNSVIGPKKADSVGLEWSEGKGTNCGGRNDGAPCKYFKSPDGKDGICRVIGEQDNKVDWDDCCVAHDGPSMDWRDAQKILKEKP